MRVGRQREALRESYETVWQEREDLVAELRSVQAALEAERATRTDLERRLRQSILVAESTAAKLREQARKESQSALRKARARADELTAAAEQRLAVADAEAKAIATRADALERAAEAEAAQVLAAAQAEADRILAEAERGAEQALALSRVEHGEIADEVARMRRTYEEFLDTLIHAAQNAGSLLDDVERPVRASVPKRAGASGP